MPNDVQQFYASEAKTVAQIITVILVINNLPVRILARFHIRFFKPSYPLIILASHEKSIDWITGDRIRIAQKTRQNKSPTRRIKTFLVFSTKKRNGNSRLRLLQTNSHSR